MATGLCLLAGAETGGLAQATKVRITDFNDLTFGQLAGVSDAYLADDICAYSSTSGYFVTATGSGSGGAFSLASASSTLPYEVMWVGAPGQTTGTALSAGVTSSAFTNPATQLTCNSGPPSTASLIVVIRANTVSAAQAGSYTGTLSIMIAPQ
jgi:hypothetical protein